jgi:Subtilase family
MTWQIWKQTGDTRPKSWLAQMSDLKGWDSHMLWVDMTHFAKLQLSTGSSIQNVEIIHRLRQSLTGRPSGDDSNDESVKNKARTPVSVIFEANEQQITVVRNSKKIKLFDGSKFSAPYYSGFVAVSDLAWLKSRVSRLRIGMIDTPETRSFSKRSSRKNSGTLSQVGSDVVLGIIDHGIAFANRDFANLSAAGWTTRIESFWHQQYGYPRYVKPGAITLHPPTEFGYGWEIDSSYINGVMNFDVDDADIYSSWNDQTQAGWLPYEAARRQRSHGTHVLSLLAGKRTSSLHAGKLQTIADPASKMPIIAVQLPALPYKDTSGQTLTVHLLNAVEFIVQRAGNRKVVINISDGAYAGPHDGTSLLETALDKIVSSSHGQVHIVTAAGNQFNERIHWQDQIEKLKSAELYWQVLPDDKTDSHLEIWFDQSVTEDLLRQISVEIESPSGYVKSMPIQCGQFAWLNINDKILPSAAAFFCSQPTNSLGKAVFHLALAPTRAENDSQQGNVPHGIWKIRLHSTNDQSISFHAYIERDNPAMGDKGPRRQSYFVHPSYPRDGANGCQSARIESDLGNVSPIKRLGTLNNIATAAQVKAVGGYIGKSRYVASYSAAGPGRGGSNPNVDFIAPSEESNSSHGIIGCGVRSGTYFKMGGTSVASPQIARAIANSLVDVAPLPAVNPPVRGIPERIGNGIGGL